MLPAKNWKTWTNQTQPWNVYDSLTIDQKSSLEKNIPQLRPPYRKLQIATTPKLQLYIIRNQSAISLLCRDHVYKINHLDWLYVCVGLSSEPLSVCVLNASLLLNALVYVCVFVFVCMCVLCLCVFFFFSF